MCEFQQGTYECRGDGYVWDADADGYDPDDHSWACPCCNTRQYLLNAKDDAESTLSFSSVGHKGSGVTIWESAVRVATEWNQSKAEEALKAIGEVRALYEDNQAEYECGEKVFTYPSQAIKTVEGGHMSKQPIFMVAEQDVLRAIEVAAQSHGGLAFGESTPEGLRAIVAELVRESKSALLPVSKVANAFNAVQTAKMPANANVAIRLILRAVRDARIAQ